MPSSFRVPGRRSVTLAGSEAVSWLVERGRTPTGSASVRLVSDEITAPGIRLGRIWHTAADLSIAGSSRALLLLSQIEGTSILRVPSWRRPAELAAGQVAVLPAGSTTASSSAGPVARYEFEVDPLALPAAAEDAIGGGVILDRPSPAFRDALMSATNAALNAPERLDGAGFSSFALGIRSLCGALLLDALSVDPSVDPGAADDLFREASDIIAVHAADPDLTVERLAALVRTSDRNLRQIFARHGRSPKSVLTAARATLARGHLDVETSPRLSMSDIARLSGFHDAQALRRALRSSGSTGGPSRPTGAPTEPGGE